MVGVGGLWLRLFDHLSCMKFCLTIRHYLFLTKISWKISIRAGDFLRNIKPKDRQLHKKLMVFVFTCSWIGIKFAHFFLKIHEQKMKFSPENFKLLKRIWWRLKKLSICVFWTRISIVYTQKLWHNIEAHVSFSPKKAFTDRCKSIVHVRVLHVWIWILNNFWVKC